jgi:hypothetical protein
VWCLNVFPAEKATRIQLLCMFTSASSPISLHVVFFFHFQFLRAFRTWWRGRVDTWDAGTEVAVAAEGRSFSGSVLVFPAEGVSDFEVDSWFLCCIVSSVLHSVSTCIISIDVSAVGVSSVSFCATFLSYVSRGGGVGDCLVSPFVSGLMLASALWRRPLQSAPQWFVIFVFLEPYSSCHPSTFS